ncbi:MAG: hypothetical protein ACYC9Y_00755 [Candidatus Methylomirabilia bacterium]
MKTNLLHTVTLGTLLTLTAAPHAIAMDHSAMDHSKMGHGAAVVTAAAEKPAPANQEIRTAVVNGYTLAYTLIDLNQAMAASATPMTHGGEKMKSHHLMVNPVAPDRKPVAGGKAGYLVVQPDKTEVKAMAMLMEGGFGADVDLVVKGDYKITAKIVLADNTTLVDEFVYTVK